MFHRIFDSEIKNTRSACQMQMPAPRPALWVQGVRRSPGSDGSSHEPSDTAAMLAIQPSCQLAAIFLLP